MAEKLLDVRNLRTYFFTRAGVVKAIEDVSFYLAPGETLGLVGESGSGKSVTSLSVMRLLEDPPGRIVGGEILFKGDDVLDMNEDQLRKIRGGNIAMIFQDPMTSLNPVLTIGQQLTETIRAHLKVDDRAATERAVEMLDRVRIPEARRRLSSYPHEFSGGMRQRVMIAIALSCNPELLIADEPTTALDVTIQAQVLDLIAALGKEFNTATLLITHDLGVVAGTCDRVQVMYAGRIVEATDTRTLFKMPAHPYTQALLKAVPRPENSAERSSTRSVGVHPSSSTCRRVAPRATVSQGAAALPPGDASIDGCRAEPEGGLLLSVLIPQTRSRPEADQKEAHMATEAVQPQQPGNQQSDEDGWTPTDRVELRSALLIGTWHRFEQRLRVGVRRHLEERARIGRLDDTTGVHDLYTVTGSRDDAQIVRNEQRRGVEFLAQRGDEIEHLRLDGHIERRGRLVGDEQFEVCTRAR